MCARAIVFASESAVPAPVALSALADPSYLAHLRDAWAYVTLGASSILTEELGPMLGGFAAEQGHLGFVRVIVACTVGVWTSEALLYALGRWRAGWVRLKLRRSPPVVKRLLRSMRSAPWRCTFLARFILGGRIALPLACGAARVPIWIFLTGTAIASAIWSAVFVTLGWFFGESAMLALGHVRRYEDALAVLLVALGVGAFLWVRRRQRRSTTTELVTSEFERFDDGK